MTKRPSSKRRPTQRRTHRQHNRLTHGSAPATSVHLDHDVSAFPIDQSANGLALARWRLDALLETQRVSPPEAWLGCGIAVWRYINTIMARTQKNSIRA